MLDSPFNTAFTGFSSPFGRLMTSIAALDPTTLFGVSDTGWVYDLSDMSTLFQNAAGTTPVTAVGQPVGLELDKSKGAGYSGGVFTGLASEQVINGDFQTDVSEWSQNSLGTLTWVAGRARIVSTGTTSAYQAFSVIAGKTYVVSGSLEVTQHPGSNENATVSIRSGTGASTTELLRVATVSGGTGTASATVLYVAATTATVYIHLRLFGALTAEFDNISVRELPGNHRTQSTALNRPTYARHPLGGIRNLLTRTEGFENATWVKTNVTVTANAGVSPDGATTADLMTATGTNANLFRSIGFSGVQYTFSVYAKRGNSDWIAISNSGFFVYFDIQNGALGTVGNGSASIQSIGDGWYRCIWTPSDLTQNTSWRIRCAVANGNTSTTTETALIWGAQLETGSTATPYQRVGSTFDVTEAGVEDLYYLSYDGINDSLATASFAWGTDKATVVAGVRKLSDAATGILVESSDDSGSQNGSFRLSAPQSSVEFYRFRSRGTLPADAGTTSSIYGAPTTNVLTGIGNISGDTSTLRIDGIQVAQTTTDQGTGNFLTYPVYFGARAGASLFFNGREYSNVGINRLLTTDELAALESWTAGKNGVTL
jgi:hypothetical protein